MALQINLKGPEMAQTKSQLWTAAQEIIAEIPTSKNFTEADLDSFKSQMAELYAPKSKSSANPSYEEDGVEYHWCKYHNRYEKSVDMVLDKEGKGKGYCKAASSLSNHRRQLWREANDKISELLISGNMEEAQELAPTVKELKDSINNPDTFDYDADWERFLTPPVTDDEPTE